MWREERAGRGERGGEEMAFRRAFTPVSNATTSASMFEGALASVEIQASGSHEGATAFSHVQGSACRGPDASQ